jgi:2-polyprenyl-6-methoxyphenol hydroxylase-like FAD-dependent oxidoreductase
MAPGPFESTGRCPAAGVWWGANLPSKGYLSLTEARETPAEDWLRTLRDTNADDVPGEMPAWSTAPEALRVTGALHIMPPVPRWHRGRMVPVGDAVHAPSNSSGQGASVEIESGIQLARSLRDELSAPSAFCNPGYARVRSIREPRASVHARGAEYWFSNRR